MSLDDLTATLATAEVQATALDTERAEAVADAARWRETATSLGDQLTAAQQAAGAYAATVAQLNARLAELALRPIEEYDQHYGVSDEATITATWGPVTIVDLVPLGGGDLDADLENTLARQSGRVVVRLPAGIYWLRRFRMIGKSGDPNYATGFWNTKLQGLLGAGALRTFVFLAPNVMTDAQLARLAQLTTGNVNQMMMGRLDGTNVRIGGITFGAADQQPLTAVHSTVAAKPNAPVLGQPAPHAGIVLYSGATAIVSYCHFAGAAHLWTSEPPFEHANIGSQYGQIRFEHCTFDGRRHPLLDPARPRRCAPVMANNETSHTMEDCRLSHSGAGRYAYNAQNRETRGTLALTRCTVDHIADNRNTDPALNGGKSLGGVTNPSCLGFETSADRIELTDVHLRQDNPDPTGRAQHIQLTYVGARSVASLADPGPLVVRGGTFRHVQPALDGMLCLWVPKTAGNTWADLSRIEVYGPDGTRLQPWEPGGTYPPARPAGVGPATHYYVGR